VVNKKDTLRTNVERVVKNYQALPVPRYIANEVQRISLNGGAIQDLARYIEADATLSIRVLRSINSVAYGLPRKISNIHEAVALLGFRQLSELCSDLTVFTPAQERDTRYGYNRIELWKHSLGTAIACKLINEQLTGRSDPTVYVAGLLCNIGRSILDTYFTRDFNLALKLAFEEEISLRQAERRVFGATSEAVGYWAASCWDLAESLADSLNENYVKSSSGNAWLVDLGRILTESLGMGRSGNRSFSLLRPGVLRDNRINRTTLESIIEMLSESFKDLRSIYGKVEQPLEKQVQHDS